MVKNRTGIAVAMLAAVSLHISTISPLKNYRERLRSTVPLLYLPPAGLLSTLSLDYKNILSEIFIFRSINYYGDRLLKKAHPDWEWFYKMLDASVTLDPYNIDAFYVAQAILPWEVGMVKEANTILEKGIKHRTWDWSLPFFAGFNYSYFMRDNRRAAIYFKKAAMLNPTVATVAGKYMQKSGDFLAGIAFLKAFLSNTANEDIKKGIRLRIRSLENAVLLQRGVNRYRRKYNKLPDSFNVLIAEKIIREIPKDPYKKEYFITPEGRVDLRVVKKRRKKREAKGR